MACGLVVKMPISRTDDKVGTSCGRSGDVHSERRPFGELNDPVYAEVRCMA